MFAPHRQVPAQPQHVLSQGLWDRAGVPLPLEVALRWGIDVATALAELHLEGVLVLDVK